MLKLSGFLFMLEREQILDLQKIIREDFDKDLPYEEVERIARDLVGGFDLLARISHEISQESKSKELVYGLEAAIVRTP